MTRTSRTFTCANILTYASITYIGLTVPCMAPCRNCLTCPFLIFSLLLVADLRHTADYIECFGHRWSKYQLMLLSWYIFVYIYIYIYIYIYCFDTVMSLCSFMTSLWYINSKESCGSYGVETVIDFAMNPSYTVSPSKEASTTRLHHLHQ